MNVSNDAQYYALHKLNEVNDDLRRTVTVLLRKQSMRLNSSCTLGALNPLHPGILYASL